MIRRLLYKRVLYRPSTRAAVPRWSVLNSATDKSSCTSLLLGVSVRRAFQIKSSSCPSTYQPRELIGRPWSAAKGVAAIYSSTHDTSPSDPLSSLELSFLERKYLNHVRSPSIRRPSTQSSFEGFLSTITARQIPLNNTTWASPPSRSSSRIIPLSSSTLG